MVADAPLAARLPTEQQIEDEVNSYTGLMKNFRIAKCEYKRFAMLGIMFGIIGFIYSFMRILKDNYVMSRQVPNCILYIKILYIMPLSFIVVIGVNYLLTSRTVSKLFSVFCIGFMSIFFFLGTVVIFEDRIMFNTTVIESKLATNSFETRGLGFLKYFLLTVNEPLATTVYIVAEMWGSLILSYLFLSFMNEMCTEKQHNRFIPPLFIIANLSLLLSALVTTAFFKVKDHLTNEQNTMFMGGIFFLEGILVLGVLFCKYVLENKIVTKPIFVSSSAKKAKKQKVAIGFKEGLAIMMKSKFLMAMCAIVCFYSICFNILETVFKNGIKKGADAAGVEPGKYSGKYNNLDQYVTSISVIALNLSSFSTFVDKRGWLVVAMITPVIGMISTICILGLGSYNAATEEDSLKLFNSIFGGSRSRFVMENLLGTLCLAAMKIFKYTAFDVTKERISMRIEGRYRPKFKSIYDGIFNKFGKSMGALYGIVISSVFTDIDLRGMSPITSIFIVLFISIWMLSILYLGKLFNKSLKLNEPIDIDLVESDEEDETNIKKE